MSIFFAFIGEMYALGYCRLTRNSLTYPSKSWSLLTLLFSSFVSSVCKPVTSYIMLFSSCSIFLVTLWLKSRMLEVRFISIWFRSRSNSGMLLPTLWTNFGCSWGVYIIAFAVPILFALFVWARELLDNWLDWSRDWVSDPIRLAVLGLKPSMFY